MIQVMNELAKARKQLKGTFLLVQRNSTSSSVQTCSVCECKNSQVFQNFIPFSILVMALFFFYCLSISSTTFVTTLRFIWNMVNVANEETENIWFVSCAELRLRQSVFESKDGELSCSYTSGEQEASEHQPTLEETVESLFRRLREKRQTLGLPDNTKVRIRIKVRTTFIAKWV